MDEASDIHARLCADDPVATSDLANAYFDILSSWLRRKNPGLDLHLYEQAAGDAIISLMKNPRSFKPEKGTLDGFLRMSAQGDLKNALARERRHSARRESLEVVELRGAGGNRDQEDDPASIVEREADQRDADNMVIPSQIAQSFTPEERQVIALMLDGERSTHAFAQVLAIASLPEEEQRVQVKRVKDRIKKRLQRARGGR